MKKIFFMAVAATAMLAACNKTEVVYNDAPQEIAMFAVNKVATKAPVADVTFLTTDDMRVSAYLAAAPGNESNVGEYFSNIKFTHHDGGLWTGGQYWPLFQSTLNFLAVTEKGGNVDNTTVAFGSTSYAEVTLADNDAYDQNDLMYAIGKGTTNGAGNYGPVNMIFRHSLAWVNFAFKSNIADVITVKSIALTAKYNGVLALSFPEYNKVDAFTNNALTANWLETYLEENKEQYVPNANHNGKMTSVTLPASDSDDPYIVYGGGLMVVPGAFVGRQFVITYDIASVDKDGNMINKEFTYTYPVTQNWEMGKKYTYNINITLDEIEIEPDVAEWATGSFDIPLL